jgi:hypothetical protein
LTTKIGPAGGEFTFARDPDADGYRTEWLRVGGTQRALDGSMQTTQIAWKRKWACKWSGISYLDTQTLEAAVLTTDVLYFYPPIPNGQVQVAVVLTSYTCEAMPEVPSLYTVNLEVEQV